MTDVDVDMESVINGGRDYIDFEFMDEHDDEETYYNYSNRYCTGPKQYSKYTDSLIDDQASKFSYLDIVPVKPRKIVASQSDFQQKFKTEMCRNWEMSKCPFGPECTFAHGEHELLQKSHIHTNYRTKKCNNFYDRLYCPYGNRCQFYHADQPEHLKPPKKESYLHSLNEIKQTFTDLTSEFDN